jgi:hypothetical protein
MEVTSDKMRENNSAHQKLSTLNPSTKRVASIIIQALITNRKRPNENTVTGMVSTIIIGFKIALRNESTKATMNAVSILSFWMCTPGRSQAVMATASAEIIRLTMNVVSCDIGLMVNG